MSSTICKLSGFEREEFRELLIAYTRAMTPIADMAAGLNISEITLREILEEDEEMRAAYKQTRAVVAAQLRKQEILLAEAGSPAALQNVANYIDQIYGDLK